LHLISTIKEPVTLNKAVHFAMSTSNFNAFLKTIQDEKITYSDWLGELNTVTTRADGIKQIYIQDPDGYWIEINGE
jgi:lactoylglutathione lyase